MLSGSSLEGAVTWSETWWEASDYTGLKELGAEKEGQAADGSKWKESWTERLYYASNDLDSVVERQAHKWAVDENVSGAGCVGLGMGVRVRVGLGLGCLSDVCEGCWGCCGGSMGRGSCDAVLPACPGGVSYCQQACLHCPCFPHHARHRLTHTPCFTPPPFGPLSPSTEG